MRRFYVLCFTVLCCFAMGMFGQVHRVDPRLMHHRVIWVGPIQGDGSPKRPFRPDHVPASLMNPGAAADETDANALLVRGQDNQRGIIAFTFQPSDDGKWAIAEFVAVDRSALLPILNDNRPGVWSVEIGTMPRPQIQAILRRFKKNLDLNQFQVVVR
jgi:hypothetical protein